MPIWQLAVNQQAGCVPEECAADQQVLLAVRTAFWISILQLQHSPPSPECVSLGELEELLKYWQSACLSTTASHGALLDLSTQCAHHSYHCLVLAAKQQRNVS